MACHLGRYKYGAFLQWPSLLFVPGTEQLNSGFFFFFFKYDFQFILIVAASSVGEELFYRAAVQV